MQELSQYGTVLALVLIAVSMLLNRKDHQRIMAQLDDLNTAITAVSTGITGVAADIDIVIADFVAAEAALAAGGSVDLSAPIAALTAIASTLATLDATVKAAIPATVVPS